LTDIVYRTQTHVAIGLYFMLFALHNLQHIRLGQTDVDNGHLRFFGIWRIVNKYRENCTQQI